MTEVRDPFKVPVYYASPINPEDFDMGDLRLDLREMNRVYAGRSGEMSWVAPDGKRTCRYRGELVDLGFAIPRNPPATGVRRFVWDLAHGYASGFPAWHVLVFSFRSAFMPRANARRIARNLEMTRLGLERPVIEWPGT